VSDFTRSFYIVLQKLTAVQPRVASAPSMALETGLASQCIVYVSEGEMQ
jgi:hypothetical protein